MQYKGKDVGRLVDVLVGPAGEPADLSPGDYITYPGDAPHIFKALEPDTTAVMIMEHI